MNLRLLAVSVMCFILWANCPTLRSQEVFETYSKGQSQSVDVLQPTQSSLATATTQLPDQLPSATPVQEPNQLSSATPTIQPSTQSSPLGTTAQQPSQLSPATPTIQQTIQPSSVAVNAQQPTQPSSTAPAVQQSAKSSPATDAFQQPPQLAPATALQPTQLSPVTPAVQQPAQSSPASVQQPSQLVDPEQVKAFAAAVREKLPEVMDKDRIHKLADQVGGIMTGGSFGFKTINLESIPSPVALTDAYWATLDKFVPEMFPELQIIPKLIAMRKFYTDSVKESPEKLFAGN